MPGRERADRRGGGGRARQHGHADRDDEAAGRVDVGRPQHGRAAVAAEHRSGRPVGARRTACPRGDPDPAGLQREPDRAGQCEAGQLVGDGGREDLRGGPRPPAPCRLPGHDLLLLRGAEPPGQHLHRDAGRRGGQAGESEHHGGHGQTRAQPAPAGAAGASADAIGASGTGTVAARGNLHRNATFARVFRLHGHTGMLRPVVTASAYSATRLAATRVSRPAATDRPG